jgi:hypothetical protein
MITASAATGAAAGSAVLSSISNSSSSASGGVTASASDADQVRSQQPFAPTIAAVVYSDCQR